MVVPILTPDDFIDSNEDLSLDSRSDVHFHVIRIHGRLHFLMEVGEDTTNQQLRDAIPEALSWSDRLLAYQGIDTPTLQRADDWHKEGRTYAQIANAWNEWLEQRLEDHIHFEKEMVEWKQHWEDWEKFLSELTPEEASEVPDVARNPIDMEMPTSDAFDKARRVLKEFYSKKENIDIVLNEGLENIKRGEPPFGIGYPLSDNEVASALRRWRRREAMISSQPRKDKNS
jgi:hypothetical protein